MGESPPCRTLSGEEDNGPSFQSLLSHGEQSAIPATAEKRELHAQIVQAQGIGQNHAEQGKQEHIGKGEGRAQVPAETLGKQIGHAAQQANDGKHQGGPHQRRRRIAEP